MIEVYITFTSGNVENMVMVHESFEKLLKLMKAKDIFVFENTVINCSLIEFISWYKKDNDSL